METITILFIINIVIAICAGQNTGMTMQPSTTESPLLTSDPMNIPRQLIQAFVCAACFLVFVGILLLIIWFWKKKLNKGKKEAITAKVYDFCGCIEEDDRDDEVNLRSSKPSFSQTSVSSVSLNTDVKLNPAPPRYSEAGTQKSFPENGSMRVKNGVQVGAGSANLDMNDGKYTKIEMHPVETGSNRPPHVSESDITVVVTKDEEIPGQLASANSAASFGISSGGSTEDGDDEGRAPLGAGAGQTNAGYAKTSTDDYNY